MTAAASLESPGNRPAAVFMETQHTGILDQSKLVSLTSPTIKWAQLERGKLDVGYRVVQAAPLVVSSRTASLGIQVEAALEPGRTAIVSIESLRPGTRWFGQAVDAQTVALSREGLDLRTSSLSVVSAIVVSREELQSRYPNSLDAADVVAGLDHIGVSRRPAAAACLRKSIESVCANREMPAQSVSGALIPMLAAALHKPESYSVERNEVASRRFTAVRICEEYMREHLDDRPTLLDLSIVCGMRSRSLINAFEAITGFGPMDYLKRLRLGGVRRALQRADRAQVKIIDIAMDWGFWHMGHFARDYRIMFGESPSQTLPR